MWDEKKFFEDYVKESGKIKPDREFVDDLKKMADENVKVKKAPKATVRYMAAGIAAVVCIGAGAAWNYQKEPAVNTQQKNVISAEAPDKSTMITSKDTKDPKKQVLEALKQGDEVLDEDECSVSQEEQEALYDTLKRAEKTEEDTDSRNYMIYKIKTSDDVIEIFWYSDGKIKIQKQFYQCLK